MALCHLVALGTLRLLEPNGSSKGSVRISIRDRV